MCGIAGYLSFTDKQPNLTLLKKMTDVISYRGPDDQGQEIIGAIGLGSRRLAIIDLSPRGHMPMSIQKKRFWIVYNGEIYNFKSLRAKLQNLGVKFISGSDTEVILQLYAKYGPKMLKMLEGMFSMAIWDSKKQELMIARDPFGIKPLHYYLDNQVFIFSSEIKSILLHPHFKKELNNDAISHYFSLGFGCVATPITIFKNIYKLAPGNYAIIKNANISLNPYFSWQKNKKEDISFDEAVKKVRDDLENSVKSQLVADVDIGSFLSGGLDSSLITAMAQKHHKRKLKTFSIGFDDPDFDESKYALQVSKHLKTEHFHHQFKVKDAIRIIPEIVKNLDEPLADASILPTYLLSKFTRKHVTVALSGDGGDEIFAGYPTYIAHRISKLANLFPKNLLNLGEKFALISSNLINQLPISKHAQNLPIRFKIKRAFSGLDKNSIKQYINYTGPMLFDKKDNLILNHTESALPILQNLIANKPENMYLPQYLDLMIYLSEDCLVKVDRASSYNSLEVRPPILNANLAKFAINLPTKYHLKNNELKHLLKIVAEPYLPKEIIYRPKKGFGIPTHKWLKEDLKPQLFNLLDKKRLKKQGIFNPNYVQTLLDQHFTNIEDHRMVLWNLYIFQLWFDEWM